MHSMHIIHAKICVVLSGPAMYDMSKSTNEAFMTTPSISFEIKSQLAKLLATENLTIRHNPSAHTAYFDTKSRELVLPVWQNISEDL